jgi:hypothetical protein
VSAASDEGRQLAATLRQRGLAAPVRLLLDAHRPLRPLLSEAGAALAPVLRPLLGRRQTNLQTLLDSEETYDGLIDALGDAEHR